MTSQAKDTNQQALPSADLAQIYCSSLRQRFKDEVNRLSNGGMRHQLGDIEQADDWAFLLTYVQMWRWLRMNVGDGWISAVLSAFAKGKQGFLMALLEQSADEGSFVRGYAQHWLQAQPSNLAQQAELMRLLASRAGSIETLVRDALSIWDSLGLFAEVPKAAYARLAKEEKSRYAELLGEADQQRLALVDALAGEPTRQFNKIALIPHMGCPQTCRHCMFIFRPLVKDYPDPGKLFNQLNGLSSNLLFTGGDLSNHLQHFYRAIREMRSISQFAILLNGEFATSLERTHEVLAAMSSAVAERPKSWLKARVLLQISFDEFHQEVMLDKQGRPRERIPVASIANIVEASVRYPAIQLALLHKQTRLNFSMDVLQKGVFARLTQELGRRGHQLQVLSALPSAVDKPDPLNPAAAPQRVLKDATFILTQFPDRPVLLTSSTIDAYGRAELLDEAETLKDRQSLEQLLAGQQLADGFDTDPMFWFDGRVTLFSATHISLGNLYQDGLPTILARHAKDPLLAALRRFDRRLLDWYEQIRDDLPQLKAKATSAHQLFHQITEPAEVRLHLTRQLVGSTSAGL